MFDVIQPYDTVRGLFHHICCVQPFHEELLNRHMRRERLYHGVIHLGTMWQVHLALRPNIYMAVPDQRIASAIALHDAIYDARASDNEAQSAALWRQHATTGQETIDWVAEAILATKDHLAERATDTPEKRLREWFVGLDLASLAAPEHIFDVNNLLIRLEYRHVPDDVWRVSSAAFLQRFVDAPVIFKHPVLRHVFEQPARDNLKRHLARV